MMHTANSYNWSSPRHCHFVAMVACIYIYSMTFDKLNERQLTHVHVLVILKPNQVGVVVSQADPLSCKELKLLKVKDILWLQELKCYYKYKNYKLPHYLQNLPLQSNKETHNYATRTLHNIHHPKLNTNMLRSVYDSI